ncbi:C39 family peptidase [Glacieibacterium frigidum]|uniref:C39 family peptidase n=1 Tax=Glacieibacterium frigidum TaxID=2593303 RepID=A0A552UG70_9SPHN|nr:C39 family peptidase [Glacieibacterium frigidum]TRW17232.1 C39 family peptidase [Glacieibacterium frigidum]
MSRSARNVAVVALLLGGCSAATPSGTNRLAIGNFEAGLPVASMYERRFATVIRQNYDFSCGSAALATLLRFHYARPVDEQATFVGMWAGGDRAAIRKLGFSLLDMKRYLAANGLSADGYQVSLAQIAKARIPGIALIETGGYKHFVVVKGIKQGLGDETVLLGDPSTGLRRMPVHEFIKAWNGVFFVVGTSGPEVQATFARASELALAPGARTTLQMEPISQAALALTRPGPGDL